MAESAPLLTGVFACFAVELQLQLQCLLIQCPQASMLVRKYLQGLLRKQMLYCRLAFLWQHGGWQLEATWPHRHGPSQIPTDLDLPHKAFGSQVVEDSCYQRPEILPFSIYAACRILDTTPDDEVGACMPFLSSHREGTYGTVHKPTVSTQ